MFNTAPVVELDNDGLRDVGSVPSQMLLLRGLDKSTSDKTVKF